MVKLTFNDLKFEAEKDRIKTVFLRIFYFYLDKKELKEIAGFRVKDGSIFFDNISENKAQRKFSFLLEKGFGSLRNSITGKKAVYIHINSGIPLIGNIAFGIIDRGTSVIEVKPITGCNIDCSYCSVDQNKRITDFVVEKDYLVQELRKIVEFKQRHSDKGLEVHIGANGEPLLYADLIALVEDVSRIKGVKDVSLETNGTLLTKTLVDQLVKAGLTQFNLSVNALEQEKAREIASSKAYNINIIKDIAKYIAANYIVKNKVKLIIAPVWIPGINDDEIPRLIEFAKEVKADIGIQNFLNYRYGKNPVKGMNFDVFIAKMKGLEEVSGCALLNKHANIIQIKGIKKPFKKGDTITAEIKCDGRFKDEKIAVSKCSDKPPRIFSRLVLPPVIDSRKDNLSGNRNITILGCKKEHGIVRIKIVRNKHNIFLAKLT